MITGEAWAEVGHTIRLGQHRFRNGDATWSSPLVEQAFSASGGWANFRYALEDAQMGDRARFIQAFEQLQAQDQAEKRQLQTVAEGRRLVAETAKQLSAERPQFPAASNQDTLRKGSRIPCSPHGRGPLLAASHRKLPAAACAASGAGYDKMNH